MWSIAGTCAKGRLGPVWRLLSDASVVHRPAAAIDRAYQSIFVFRSISELSLFAMFDVGAEDADGP
jgi:hypothetical protein